MVEKVNTNLQVIAEDYVKLMISQTSGMKSIIFDSDTKIMFSLVIAKSFAIKEEIFMFEELKNLKPENKFLNVKGIFFIRPTEENLELLSKILKEPNFADIYINFTNVVGEDYIKSLAYADEYAAIKAVNEIYLDYFILNNQLFHLNVDVNLMLKNLNLWKSVDHMMAQRIADGITSICLSLRMYPVIKHVKNNEYSNLIANKVLNFLQDNSDLIHRNCGNQPNGLLFIYDRKEDPITPLLTQWTYQSMIHEVFTISQNIVEVKNEKLVLSDHDDKFFKENLEKEFGEVANKINDKVNDLGRKRDNEKMESFEEIKKYIESLPDKKRESMEITKHTSIIFELTKIMEDRKLLDFSSLEQDIACFDNKKEQLSKVVSYIKNNDPIYSKSQLEKLKLVLLFCLRYEEDSFSINSLKQVMKENNLSDYVNYIDQLIKYCGHSKRNCDLLNNKDFLSKHFSKISSAFKDIPNVFTQHTSLLFNLMKKMLEKGGKVNEIDTLNNYTKLEKFNKIVILSLGGATYEEARDMTNLAKSNKIEIVYGGTNMINSKLFLQMLENQ